MKTKFHYQNNAAPSPNSPHSLGCVAIIKKDNLYLLEKRIDSSKWAFIGGRLEYNETLEECMYREIYEETNLISKNIDLWQTFSDPTRIIEYPDGRVKRIISIVFFVSIKDFTSLRCSEESKKLKFHSLIDIDSLNLAETHIPILDALKKEAMKKPQRINNYFM